MSSTKNLNRAVLTATLIFIALVNYITMPRFFYSGDNMAIKAETAQLLNVGRIGFHYAEKSQIDGFLEQRGTYFFDNSHAETYYSKYGLAYTLCYVPALYLKKVVFGKLSIIDTSDNTLFIINYFSIILSLIYSYYLYQIFSLYNQSPWQRMLLVLLSIYSSYVWYYLRSPDKEIFQMVSFTGATYHALAFLRTPVRGTPSWKHLSAALAWAGLTYLLKPLYVLLFLTVLAFSGWKLKSYYRREQASSQPMLSLLSAATIISSAVLGISMLFNYLRTGSVMVSGYGQDMRFTEEFIFTASHFYQGLATYFWKTGNGNWFLHQPLLILAVFGYVGFFKAQRNEAIFLTVVATPILIALCFHCEWIGEWCYGPRFCLHLIMVASIPAAGALRMLTTRPTGRSGKTIRLAAFTTLAVIALISFRAQIYVNSWHYFTSYDFSGGIESLNRAELNKYFANLPHRAVLYRDLSRYNTAGKRFAMLDAVDQSDLPDGSKAGVYNYLAELFSKDNWNYMLLKNPA